jgi:hypothetical protein
MYEIRFYFLDEVCINMNMNCITVIASKYPTNQPTKQAIKELSQHSQHRLKSDMPLEHKEIPRIVWNSASSL